MKFKVTNMTCGHCVMTIERTLNNNGFDSVEINLDNRTVNVDLKGRTEEEVVQIIESVGYDVKL